MPIIELDSDMMADAEEAFTDLLSTNVAGKNCRLYMTPKMINCVNCIPDPIGGKSSNRWLTGGPYEFHTGLCPLCNGAGKKAQEITEDIVMTIDLSPQAYKFFSNDIRLPAGSIVTRGLIVDMPKVKRCMQMRILSNVPSVDRYTYSLSGEPIDPFQFVKGKFFGALWIRAGTIGVA